MISVALQWSFGGGSLSHSRETVNTAIVDIYQGGDESVLKSRVRCNTMDIKIYL